MACHTPLRPKTAKRLSPAPVSTFLSESLLVYLRVDEDMKKRYLPALLLLLSVATLGQTKENIIPQKVEFPSGTLHLKAYLWKPAGPGPFPAVLFSHGSGGKEADITAGMQITESADILAPFFIKHGYAFLYPFRRGHGPSADQAPFMQDVLRREEKEKGREARQHLQFKLLTTDQLDDVMAALAFLKTVPGIDYSPHRCGWQFFWWPADFACG
jgi:predicted dienelactone hydrolase